MHVKNLYLYQFRNCQEAFFEFSPAVNLICGPNARGKTSILEAIALLMAGRSFRTVHLSEVIKNQTSSFFIKANFIKYQIPQQLTFSSTLHERKILYNATVLRSVSSLLGIIQGVAVTPDDINLIKGPPQVRRQFLDLQIAQADPLYIHHSTRYHRAMRQRNALLKSKKMTAIECWEHEMAASAAYLIRQRILAAADLQKHIGPIYLALAGASEEIELEYKNNLRQTGPDLEGSLLTHWRQQRPRELLLGFTLTGPHKDDLVIRIDRKEAQIFASEGQKRLASLAIRFAEWERLSRLAEAPPLLLLDDIGISLDVGRKSNLFSYLFESNKQIFITSTEESLLDRFSGEKNIITLGK